MRSKRQRTEWGSKRDGIAIIRPAQPVGADGRGWHVGMRLPLRWTRKIAARRTVAERDVIRWAIGADSGGVVTRWWTVVFNERRGAGRADQAARRGLTSST